MSRDELRAQGASAEEAAAVMAAIERFAADTAPTRPTASAPEQRWLRMARLEAVGADDERSPWGERHPWGRSPPS